MGSVDSASAGQPLVSPTHITARIADLAKVIIGAHRGCGNKTHQKDSFLFINFTFTTYNFKWIKSTVIFDKINEAFFKIRQNFKRKNPEIRCAVKNFGLCQNVGGRLFFEKIPPLTFQRRGAILKTYFGNALAAICGVSREATIEQTATPRIVAESPERDRDF